MIGMYIFIILVIRVEKICWKSLTHVWKTGMYARAGSEFVSCCNHNHHRKLQSASMLSDGNFYFIQPFYSRLFLVYIRLIPSSFLLRYNDAIKNFRGVVTWP